ncbi:MAG: ABC transporter ATP-binding protein [Flavobacterium sp.]|jgi:Cu-processing system ATP-binding protein|uniref:ABC transporter ATP-binding protein n=1 Tax=Flavobacterium sp. TaxID=239 RepID=UPI001B6894CE|nr:ABC transporter ATP-binding protein [Flavobacterium sp.]MBP6145845.1 ABC transporter ATP-binding protein [Flavobacterium sp.]MBP7182890.1 ABC transporter ATP-binding protein [Flavobacterium sp.]MBP7316977.1 ABC transporter ATP-binding protein [Flavobacterium sp.]MBP8886625.1 ABC transporter ATP-binding protein [Flavobacterium sp.]HRL70492.1 ABC transporter ATP-binding protein [Flavobacterium sp.]
MIEIKNIYKKFGKLEVLNNINLSFKKGECIALIGPNGCGKTTLIKSILGMVIPTKGDILFDQKSILKEFEYRENIGYMPQIGRYPDYMTVGQIIEMIKKIRNSEQVLDEDLIKSFELEKIVDKQMRTLSGGTTQKVSATLAFLFNPEVLILDEPTAGLDPLASEILKDKIIKEKEKGKLILITSHLLSELDDLITQIIYMQEGTVHFHQTIDDLLQSTNEQKISKAIAKILKNKSNEQNH